MLLFLKPWASSVYHGHIGLAKLFVVTINEKNSTIQK